MVRMKRLNVVLLTIALLFLCACEPAPSVSYESQCYLFDITEPREFVGFSDYVFIGRVGQILGAQTEWEGGEGLYTAYSVEVLKNIKGELDLTAPVQVKIYGGYDPEDNRLLLCSDTTFYPLSGDVCVFLAGTGKDGTLYTMTDYGNPRLFTAEEALDVTEDELFEHDLYLRYVEAYENETVFDEDQMVRKHCRYDVDVTEEELAEYEGGEFVPSEDHSEKILSILSTLDAYRTGKKDKEKEDESDKTADIGIVQSTA